MFKDRELYEVYWDWIPDPETRVLLFDIETDGLLDAFTKIHCLCAKDWLTKETFSFKYDQMDEAKKLLDSYDVLVAHNGLCFDVEVLRRLWGRNYRCFDTLTMSRLIWTDMADMDFARLRSKSKQPHIEFPKKLIGRHSLKAWGYRLGCYKGDYGEVTENAWAEWSQEMQDYCEQDVEVLEKLYEHILKQNYSHESMALEHEFQKVIFNQEQTGVWFDEDAAVKLYSEIAAERDELTRELQEEFPPKEVRTMFVPKVNNKTRGYVKGVPVERVTYIPFNPLSREQVAERLQGLGWVPVSFTETGKPTIDDEILGQLDLPCGQKLARLFEISKIIGMVGEGNGAWLKLVGRDNRIHGRVITNGAVTGRCTHNSPNLAQIPARGSFGHRCRELFRAPEGWTMMGCDASGLELRMLSSYMFRYDGGAYSKVILEGDIHTANQEAAGLPTRNDAKTFIYALMYGAGDAKLGSIVKPEAPVGTQAIAGKRLRSKFYRNIPALQRLTDDVQATAKKRKYLLGVDGRRLNVRSSHSALNTLLQSAGAVMMKYATVLFHQLCRDNGYKLGDDYVQVLHVHDEFQINCKPEIAEPLGGLAVKAIEIAGRHFGLPCPTTGEFKVGASWADTH